jgi:hypothetical protein
MCEMCGFADYLLHNSKALSGETRHLCVEYFEYRISEKVDWRGQGSEQDSRSFPEVPVRWGHRLRLDVLVLNGLSLLRISCG